MVVSCLLSSRFSQRTRSVERELLQYLSAFPVRLTGEPTGFLKGEAGFGGVWQCRVDVPSSVDVSENMKDLYENRCVFTPR